MQRLLVLLVVFLTVVVGVLGILVFDLQSDLNGLGKTRAPELIGREPVVERADDPRIAAFDRQLRQLQNEVKVLRRRAAAVPAEGGSSDSSSVDRPAAPPPLASGGSGFLNAAERVRDGNGEFQLTEEDEALFLALQQRAQLRQRIESTTKGVMRRLDRMAEKGEMASIPEADRGRVEALVKKHVAAGEEMMRRYVRQPADDMRELTFEERRAHYTAERDEVVAKATIELVPLLGEADAAKVAEASLQSPWGRRLNAGRRSLGRNKRRN